MGTNWILHILEAGLVIGFVLHIVQGLILTYQNRTKRPVKYKLKRKQPGTNWYSRSMGLLGVLILIFLIIHLNHFWVHTRLAAIFGDLDEITYSATTVDNLFARMKDVFSHAWVVIVYLAALVALAWHLAHGFQSAFRTLGMSSNKYIPIIKGIGYAFSIIVPLMFAMMPVSMYFGWVK
jgi:succinate dehydrogenase / fumarate reductase cytochrome b subunit